MKKATKSSLLSISLLTKANFVGLKGFEVDKKYDYPKDLSKRKQS
jgi:hypothetical protein